MHLRILLQIGNDDSRPIIFSSVTDFDNDCSPMFWEFETMIKIN